MKVMSYGWFIPSAQPGSPSHKHWPSKHCPRQSDTYGRWKARPGGPNAEMRKTFWPQQKSNAADKADNNWSSRRWWKGRHRRDAWQKRAEGKGKHSGSSAQERAALGRRGNNAQRHPFQISRGRSITKQPQFRHQRPPGAVARQGGKDEQREPMHRQHQRKSCDRDPAAPTVTAQRIHGDLGRDAKRVQTSWHWHSVPHRCQASTASSVQKRCEKLEPPRDAGTERRPEIPERGCWQPKGNYRRWRSHKASA